MQLVKRQLHIWHILPPEMEVSSFSDISYLSPQELVRAESFKQLQDRLWWAFVRSALRQILSPYLDTPPHQIIFRQEANGKPSVEGTSYQNIEFSLSHTKGYALLAISSSLPVGVDIERVSQISDMNSVAQGFFSFVEQEAFFGVPVSRRLQYFYRTWTRKEALIKANGLGLSAPLQDFDVPVGDLTNWQAAELRSDLALLGRHMIEELSLPSGFEGAVCLNIKSSEKIDLPELQHLRFSDIDS